MDPTPDLILRGFRGKRRPTRGSYSRRSYGRAYRPTVTLYVNEARGGAWQHPKVVIAWAPSGQRPTGIRDSVEITYQQSRPDRGQTRAAGFLATALAWSTCYAGRIDARIGDHSDRMFLGWTLALIDAARGALRADPRAERITRRDDVVLTLIAGLQRLGVDVAIFNADLRSRLDDARRWRDGSITRAA